MRAVVTRVKEAQVVCGGETVGKINKGLLVLLGVGVRDTEEEVRWMADRVVKMRIFEDEQGKLNLSLPQTGGAILAVSNFTLYADCSSRRPGFTQAARPEQAQPLYEHFLEECRGAGIHTEAGVFGGDMAVHSVNDGPVTIVLDTDRRGTAK